MLLLLLLYNIIIVIIIVIIVITIRNPTATLLGLGILSLGCRNWGFSSVSSGLRLYLAEVFVLELRR